MEQSLVLDATETRMVQEIAKHEATRLCSCSNLGGCAFVLVGEDFIVRLTFRLKLIVFNFALPCYVVLTCLLIELALH